MSFDRTTQIGKVGIANVMPLIRSLASNGLVRTVSDDNQFEQICRGDLSYSYAGMERFVEVKTEEKHTGNLFLETWSNKACNNPGWMVKSNADILIYHFLDNGMTYLFDFKMLKKWFVEKGSAFPEYPQRKNSQENDTWGKIIPLKHLSHALVFDTYCVKNGQHSLIFTSSGKPPPRGFDIIYDVETFPNCFQLCAINATTGEKFSFELSSRRNDYLALRTWVLDLKQSGARMVGFNNVGFDYPVLHFILTSGCNHPHTIYEHAKSLIESESRFGNSIKPSDCWVPQVDLFKIHHFDNKARMTSLKALEFNMQLFNISDLPFPVGSQLLPDQMNTLMDYCFNDVEATLAFYAETREQITFREQLSEKHGLDFTNFNDVKIGKEIFRLELEKAGVPCYDYSQEEGRTPRQTPRARINLADCVPPWITFDTPQFRSIRGHFENTVITETKGAFKDLTAKVAGLDYVFGTGGIHASVENESFIANKDWMILDVDVTSLYPSIAIENGYYPEHLGPKFVEVYRNLREQRLTYAKGTAENAMLKLALNGVYGASNDQFSIFYDPLYTMKTTIGGQLMLAMLVEGLLTVPGLRIIQANTDGITMWMPRHMRGTVDHICGLWEQRTRLSLEAVEYSKMFIADVNSYLAEKVDGGVKRKGRYEYETQWHQDASALVVPKVAEWVLLRGCDARVSLENWDDFFDFLLRVKVPRSSKLMMGDRQLENTQRYYVSVGGGSLVKVMPPLAKNPTVWRRIAVQSGYTVCPCNNILDANLPINYDWYQNEVEKLTLGVM
jgi:hypothetical protein